MVARTILGIDLGGALQATTGYAVLTGKRKPRIVAAGIIERANSADIAEGRLLELLDDHKPDLVAIDSPLSLPPCLVCPSFCQGPDPDRCELRSAQLIWRTGGNPLTERLCEVQLRQEFGGSKPQPTMRIAQFAVRGVALSRRLRAQRAERGEAERPALIEVYPTGSLSRWGLPDKKREEAQWDYRRKILKRLDHRISGLQRFQQPAESDGHVFDGLIAALTGWAWPDGLEGPGEDFNAASGWIWLPRRVGSSSQ